MGKAFDALNKELGLSDPSSAAGPEEPADASTDNDPLDEFGHKYAHAQDADPLWSMGLHRLTASIGREFGLFDNTKWMRDLNKVATNLATLEGDRENLGHSFVFTSPHKSAGTSSIAYHIARLLAANDSDRKVLLLDFSASDREVEESQPSETEAWEPEGNLTCFKVEISEEQLQAPIIPRRFKELLSRARHSYQWTIIDTPPLATNPALYSLARETDGAVLVAKAGVTRIQALNAISHDMEQLGIQTLGVVLNYRRFPLPKFLLRFI